MESQQGSLWAVLVSTSAVATVCIICRFFGRYLTRNPLWCDDYAALASYFMAVGYNILCYSWIRNGVGLHVRDITYAPIAKVLYNLKIHIFAGEITYAASLLFGKVSILCLYWRVFSISEARLAVKILLPCALVWFIIRLFMSIFRCSPVRSFWDSSVHGECGFTNSWFYFGTCLIHVLIDICTMALPIQQIMKLHLPVAQRLGAAAMFLFGIFVCFAAVVIMINAVTINETDLSWSLATPLIWAIAEVNLVNMWSRTLDTGCSRIKINTVFAVSIPTIKPVFFWCFGCLSPDMYKLPSRPRSMRTSRSRFTNDRQAFEIWTVPYYISQGIIPSRWLVSPVDSLFFNDAEVYHGDCGDIETTITSHTKSNDSITWRDSSLKVDGIWRGQQRSGSQVWNDVAIPQKALSPETRVERRFTMDFALWEDRVSENKRATLQ